MKYLHQILFSSLFLLFWSCASTIPPTEIASNHKNVSKSPELNLAQFSEVASENTNLLENKHLMSFRPLEMMEHPQMLMKVWLDEAMPLSFYTEEEKEIQKLVNKKTTDGIITYSPLSQEKEWTSIDFEEITPYTWKWIDLEMYREDGTLSKIHLRRPHWWMRAMGIDKVGKKVYLEMPEMGIIGYATVKKIRLNQLDTRFWDEKREGDYVSRPITGKFEHESDEVYNLYFGSNAKPLGVTASHPIWSVDRNDWVDAEDLKIGEKVKTKEEQVTLKSREKVAGTHKVYNLEIYKDHNFLVSMDKILVHNNCELLEKLSTNSLEGAEELLGKIYKDGDKLRVDITMYTKQSTYKGSLTENLLDHLDGYMAKHDLKKLEINFIDVGKMRVFKDQPSAYERYKTMAKNRSFNFSSTPHPNFVKGVNEVYNVKWTNF